MTLSMCSLAVKMERAWPCPSTNSSLSRAYQTSATLSSTSVLCGVHPHVLKYWVEARRQYDRPSMCESLSLSRMRNVQLGGPSTRIHECVTTKKARDGMFTRTVESQVLLVRDEDGGGTSRLLGNRRSVLQVRPVQRDTAGPTETTSLQPGKVPRISL